MTRVHMRVLSDINSPEPDVTLQMDDGLLPARRSLLAESSDYFKAMFQASSADPGPENPDGEVHVHCGIGSLL